MLFFRRSALTIPSALSLAHLKAKNNPVRLKFFSQRIPRPVDRKIEVHDEGLVAETQLTMRELEERLTRLEEQLEERLKVAAAETTAHCQRDVRESVRLNNIRFGSAALSTIGFLFLFGLFPPVFFLYRFENRESEQERAHEHAPLYKEYREEFRDVDVT